MIQVPVQAFQEQLHPFQQSILHEFDRRSYRFLQLRWHRRARKTTLLLNLLIRECCKNQNKVYGFIAPTYTQAKGIIWTDPNMLNRYLPHELVKRKNESELFVEFHTGCILAIRGADNPDSIRGQDYEGVAIDEWALCKREIWEEILRPVIGQNSSRWSIFGFTPKGFNHAHDYWINSEDWPGWARSTLKASQSGIIPKAELEKARLEMPDALYRQEYECDFLAGDDFCLIPPFEIENLRGVNHSYVQKRKIISCDPSQGGDECVIYVFENTSIIETKILHYTDTMKIAGEIMILGRKHHINDFAIDTIGIGRGIGDRVSELGGNVSFVNSASHDCPDQFLNKRAEMWWYLLTQIQDKEIEYPEDEELRKQISSVHYHVLNSNGKIQMEDKTLTKKRLGRSPDRADAFVYGIYHLQTVKVDERIDRMDGYRIIKRERESQEIGILNF